MFSTDNVVSVTKSAISQLTASKYGGLEDFTLNELSDDVIVDLGEKLNIADGEVTNGSAPDIFFKALMSQCGKIAIDTRAYVAQLPKLYVDPINWGLFSEMITIELSDLMVDEMWNPDGFINYNTYSSDIPPVHLGLEEGKRIAGIEFATYKPPVSAKLYKKVHGIMSAITIAREQMFTAFRSASEYSSFVAGLFNSVTNAIQLKAEVYALMTVSMGIARATALGNEINLYTEYKTLFPSSTVTVDTALQDADFLKYALMRIAETKDNIKRFTSAYNNHEHLTFASDTNTILLNKFSNAVKFNVRANTYHEELLGIGDYDRVSSWQAVVGETQKIPYAFDVASSICLSSSAIAEAESGANDLPEVLTGVIGVVYDRLAMGITIDKKKTTSQYSASKDTVNYFYHALANYVVNDNYPIVTFVIRDDSDDLGE